MGILDLDEYKKDCEKQKAYETKLIEKITKEGKIKFLEETIKRIKRRIEILEQEITQEVPQQEEDPPTETNTENPSVVQKVEEKKEEEVDYYDEKSERIIHNPDKYFSMGVLQEELVIMDKIIELKKKKKLDHDAWEMKKDKITMKMNVPLELYRL